MEKTLPIATGAASVLIGALFIASVIICLFTGASVASDILLLLFSGGALIILGGVWMIHRALTSGA